MPTARINNASAKKYTYNFTIASACSEVLCAIADVVVPRMTRAPTHGKTAVPSELNACVRFNRLEAVCGFPKTATYGFAATCRIVIPVASTINAVRKNGKDGTLAAG